MQIIVPSQHTGIYDKSAVHDFKVKAFIKKKTYILPYVSNLRIHNLLNTSPKCTKGLDGTVSRLFLYCAVS